MNDFREFSAMYNENYLMHFGRKGMRWGKSIFQDDYDPIGEVARGLSEAYNYVHQIGGRARENAYNYASQTARNARDYVNDHVTGSSYQQRANDARDDMARYRAATKRDMYNYKRALGGEHARDLGISTRRDRALQALGIKPEDLYNQSRSNLNKFNQARAAYTSNQANYNDSAAGRIRQGAQNAVDSARQTAHTTRVNLDNGLRNVRAGVDNAVHNARVNVNNALHGPGTKNLINDVRQGAQNAVDDARKQAFMLRANASVAANQAKNAINNLPGQAERKANDVLGDIRNAVNRFGVNSKRITSQGLSRAADILEKYGIGTRETGRMYRMTDDPNDPWKLVNVYTKNDIADSARNTSNQLSREANRNGVRNVVNQLNPYSNQNNTTRQVRQGAQNLRTNVANSVDRAKEELGVSVLRNLGKVLNVDPTEEIEKYRRNRKSGN